jgi:hypothetical protein
MSATREAAMAAFASVKRQAESALLDATYY